MDNSKRLLVICLGLSLLMCYVSSIDESPPIKVAKKLWELRAEKQRLEAELAKTTSMLSRRHLEERLENINGWIRHFEATYIVSSKDFLKTWDKRIEDYEKERELFLKKLEKAENVRSEALETFTRQDDHNQIEHSDGKVQELNTEKYVVAEAYAALTQPQFIDTETINKEELHLIKEREETKRKLEKAQDLRIQALEAIAAATQEGYKTVSIPYQDEINKLKEQIHVKMTKTVFEMQLILDLSAAQAKLESLLQKLYQESQHSTHRDVESELVKAESDAVRVRDQHVNRREAILQNIKDKGLTGYDEEEITSLQNANQQVTDTDKALQEIARRSAYLKAISEVKNLIEGCRIEVQDALARRQTATAIGQLPKEVGPLPSDITGKPVDLLALVSPSSEKTAVSDNKEDTEFVTSTNEKTSVSDNKKDAGFANSPNESTTVLDNTDHAELLSLPNEQTAVSDTKENTGFVNSPEGKSDVSKNGEDRELTSYKDSETIANIIYQKVSLYKDLHEFYRTKLSAEIANGLAKVNEPILIPFPGCKMNGLIDIRNKVGKWADGVQYALRLTKRVNKGDNRSKIASFFVNFLTFVDNAFAKLTGRKSEETKLEDNDELTTSEEEFGKQETFDFDKHFKYLKDHSSTLDIDAEVSKSELKEYRYNLIYLRKVPEVLEVNTLRVLKKNDESSKDEESLVEELRKDLKELNIAENRLPELYNSWISNIKSTLISKVREYQEVLDQYSRCTVE